MIYILKNKNTGVLLKYFKKIDFKHYVFTFEEATHFRTLKAAKQMKNKYKHPENWEIIKIKENKRHGNN